MKSAFLGAHCHALYHHLLMCHSGLGLSVLSESLHHLTASRKEHASDQAVESAGAEFEVRLEDSDESQLSLQQSSEEEKQRRIR